jgi:hypothetical protein
LLHIKFPIERYVTRPYRFWSTNSFFGLWGPIFVFSTPKNLYFHHLNKFSDQYIISTYWFEGLFSHLRPLKSYSFFINIKFPIDGWLSKPVFGLWGPIFTFLTPKSIYFLDLYKIFDQLMGRMTYFTFEPLLCLGIRRFQIFFELRTPINT